MHAQLRNAPPKLTEASSVNPDGVDAPMPGQSIVGEAVLTAEISKEFVAVVEMLR